ncbi:DUF3119 family protein [Thermosynechococcus sichuanensis E542]|uniref:DUF3119 family protein n=1 Tax=Thermosynechococcus sichuanensis E542 TaxID=2016101 RepID=A0A3B7MC67_9CYAN|nr:DUF3119 family protein [Thermosynechococcus vestitus]AXY67228.1 DUF3119 family protein [Thermosynechococcus vestitus E542]
MQGTALATVRLQPSFAVPLGVLLLSVPLWWLYWWLGLPISLFALFLAVQAATLRLEFTATALDVYRGSQQIRHFPYQQWQHWEVFWPAFPILFYFREVKNIHFLPILFDAKTLVQCLQERCPRTAFISTVRNDG